jgi:HSP20 family molecular chaperone IbpA
MEKGMIPCTRLKNLQCLFILKQNIMQVIVKHEGECAIYPGEYTPLPKFKSLLEEGNLSHNEGNARPFVNMRELKDGFSMEIAVAGAKKEDIFIDVHDNILGIVIVRKDYESLWEDKTQHDVIDSNTFEHFILLPDNIDSEFITSWYSQGILNFYIPKGTTPTKGKSIQVVVY